MKVPVIIECKINRLPIGYVFTYEDFNLPVEKADTLTKALSRMVQEGKIRFIKQPNTITKEKIPF